ncbi:IgA-specific serine endopeptidase [Pseudomonas sp. TE3786]
MHAEQFKQSALALIISSIFSQFAQSGTVRDDIDYMTYRNFAENRGLFRPGATDISIYFKDGSLAGTLDKAPMPDWSSAVLTAKSILVSPQYTLSATHNGSMVNLVAFGYSQPFNTTDTRIYNYQVVARNPQPGMRDTVTPRLNKLVTEVYAMPIYTGAWADLTDKSRFPIFYREGNGYQYVQSADGTKTIIPDTPGVTRYRTGGIFNTVRYYPGTNILNTVESRDVLNNLHLPLPITTEAGDSGSPLLVWDAVEKRWLVLASLLGVSGKASTYNLISAALFDQLKNSNSDPDVLDSDLNQTINWNSSALEQGTSSWLWHGPDASLVDDTTTALNGGKDLAFNGLGGTIVLNQDVDMGAGSLTFNNDYTLKAAAAQTWKGGGVTVNSDKTLTWQVNGVKGDSLHKLGTGTLLINAQGINPGELSVGEGTVILDQRADANGNVQAFSLVDIVSGRPTVVLHDAGQIDTHNLYFGFRGGRLDINGNDLSFSHVHHVDGGAQIVNHASGAAATLSVSGYRLADIPLLNWDTQGNKGIGNDLFSYKRGAITQYFALKATGSYGFFPTNATSNAQWEYLGTDETLAKQTIFSRRYALDYYLGKLGEDDPQRLNGALNFTYNPEVSEALLNLQGGSNLNGTLSIQKGTLLLSGYAQLNADGTLYGWDSSDYLATATDVGSNATLQLGNYARLLSNLSAAAGSVISLGAVDATLSSDSRSWTQSCILFGALVCQPATTTDTTPASLLRGNVQLLDNAAMIVGNGVVEGAVQGSALSSMTLGSKGLWLMRDDSQIGALRMLSGSRVALNADSSGVGYRRLDIKGDLLGSGTFSLSVDLNRGVGDSLALYQGGSGSFFLDVNPIAAAASPTAVNHLGLVYLQSSQADYSNLRFNLPTGYLDSGNYRYQLRDSGRQSWELYNPLAAQTPTPVTPTQPPAPAEPAVPQVPASAENAIKQNDWTSRRTNALLSDDAARFTAVVGQMAGLQDHLTEVAPQSSGLWTDVRHSQRQFDNSQVRDWNQYVTSTWLGADSAAATRYGDLLLGIAAAQGSASSAYAQGDKGDDRLYSAMTYAKLYLPSNLWLGASLGTHHYRTRLQNSVSAKQSGGMNTGALATGYRWQMGGFGIQPSLSATLIDAGAQSYKVADAGAVKAPASTNLQYQTGLLVDRTFLQTPGAALRGFASLGYVLNSDKQDTAQIADAAFISRRYNNLTTSDLGMELMLGHALQTSARMGYSQGEERGSEVTGSLSLKWLW